MKRIITSIAAVLLLLHAGPLHAQYWSVMTNLVDYLNLGTVNAEVDRSLGRHITLGVHGRYNNWSFNTQDPANQLQNRKASVAAVMRVYPWHIYSGWFFTSRLQYQEYNRTRFLWGTPRNATEEGDAFGAGLGMGFDYMVHENVNLELGAGAWAGYRTWTAYDCPRCGLITGSGSGAFILPDNVFISVQYIF